MAQKYDSSGRRVISTPFSSIDSLPALLDLLANLVDPDEDALLAWDDSEGEFIFVPVPSVDQFQLFSGFVNSAADAEEVPSGWSVTNDSTGVYTVTHGLGLSNTNNLRVAITLIDATNTSVRASITDRSTDSFEVTIDDDIGNADQDFFFIAQRAGA